MHANRSLDLEKILSFQRAFVRAREWGPFHTPKNLAMALAGESGELLELFQWLTPEESTRLADAPEKLKALRHEIADIFFYLLRLADHFEIDLESAIWEKLDLNAQRYPVDLARGNAKKYTQLKNP